MVYMRVMIMSGPDDGLELDLQGIPTPSDESVLSAFAIGRRETSDICIPFDISVSRLHAWLQVRRDGIWLIDQESRNGTFIGRRRIKEPESLKVGELFQVGHTWLRIQTIEHQEG